MEGSSDGPTDCLDFIHCTSEAPGLAQGLNGWEPLQRGSKRCQEPKNDFLASIYPKPVPDTLSACNVFEIGS